MLEAMHAKVKAISPKPGTEAHSLLCSLGACLGNRGVKATTLAKITKRFQVLFSKQVPRCCICGKEATREIKCEGNGKPFVYLMCDKC